MKSSAINIYQKIQTSSSSFGDENVIHMAQRKNMHYKHLNNFCMMINGCAMNREFGSRDLFKECCNG